MKKFFFFAFVFYLICFSSFNKLQAQEIEKSAVSVEKGSMYIDTSKVFILGKLHTIPINQYFSPENGDNRKLTSFLKNVLLAYSNLFRIKDYDIIFDDHTLYSIKIIVF